jgi:serine/threonine protein phosphatase PrpC
LEPVSWFSYSIPKAGNTASENEDAVFPAVGHGFLNGNSDRATFAVADGATQTSFSGLWANCLIKHCSQTQLSEYTFQNVVSKAQGEWQTSLQGLELPWHALEKVRLGAFSALAWLEIQYDPLRPFTAYTWRALAVGDCCLFIAHNHAIYLSLPLQDPSEFNNSPVLIPSKSEKMDSIKGRIKTAKGSLMRGDQLILASDAIASWIMRKTLKDRKEYLDMIGTIKDTNGGSIFSNWITNLRKRGELRNDDTSVILIDLGEGNI